MAYFICIFAIALLNLEARVQNVLNMTGEFGHSLERLRDVEKSEPVELLFLGSSHTYRGFDPRIFDQEGFSSFNLGSSSQSPMHSLMLAKRYFPKLQPKVVFVEVYWGVMEIGNGTETAIDLACNAPISSDFAEMALSTKDMLAINSVLVSYTKRLWKPLSEATQIEQPSDGYAGRGFVEKLTAKDPTEKVKKLKPYQTEILDSQLKALEELVVFCKENGSTVVLLRTPVTQEYFQLLKNYEEVTAPIQQLAEKHGIVFEDFNTRADFNYTTSTDFFDKNHLSQQGVEKFNAQLITWLKQQSTITKR